MWVHLKQFKFIEEKPHNGSISLRLNIRSKEISKWVILPRGILQGGKPTRESFNDSIISLQEKDTKA